MRRTCLSVEQWKTLMKNKPLPEAIHAVESIRQQEGLLTKDILSHLLEACTKHKDLSAARHLHSIMISMGMHTMPYMGDHLIRMFASCGCLQDAHDVFDKISHPTVYTWNAIIAAHANLGYSNRALVLYHNMLQKGFNPDKFTFLCTLKACSKLGAHLQGRCIHDVIIRSGLDSDVVLMNTVIDLYAKCVRLDEASKVFLQMLIKDVVSWGALIAGHATHGDGFHALELFSRMQEAGEEPHRMLFASLLKACGGIGAIVQGWWVHDRILRDGFESDVIIGSTLVDMYAKCGDMTVAHRLFDRLRYRDVVSWAALIQGYTAADMGGMALETYANLQKEGIKPDKFIFSSVLKACSSIRAVCCGMRIHDEIIRRGFHLDLVVGSALVNLYGTCGWMGTACNMFDRLPNRNVLSWGALIACFVQEGHDLFALALFEKMQEEDIRPDRVIFVCILQVCGRLGSRSVGYLIHEQIIGQSLELDQVIRKSLINMYIEWGNMEDAHEVFNRLLNKDVDTWGLIIKGYCQHEQCSLALELFEKMQQDGVLLPDRFLYLCILKACGRIDAIDKGRWIHNQIVRSGLDLDLVIGSTLVDMYSNCGSLEEARVVFDNLISPDVVAWGAMMAGYSQHGHAVSVLELYEKMQEGGVRPDKPILSCMLKTSGQMQAIQQGHMIYDQVIRTGPDSDAVIENIIVDMYAKCECLGEAQCVFDRQLIHDVVSWSAIITAYVQSGQGVLALKLFEKMQQEDLKADAILHSCVLKACGSIKALESGMLIHDQIITSGWESNELVGCALICMYAKCGDLEDAHTVFDRLENRDEVLWVVMIAAYAMHGHGQHALALYKEMKQEHLLLSKATVLSILKVCGDKGVIEQGQLLHSHIIKCGTESDIAIANTVVDMYAKCGSINESFHLFNQMPNRDVVTWHVMIAVAISDGKYDGGLVEKWVNEMQLEGLELKDAIFTSLLGACGQAGLVEEGLSYFNFMSSMTPNIEHYSCMINLLGRVGCLNVAEDAIQTMPIPQDVLMWTSLLNSCKTYGSVELGRRCLNQILRLDPKDASGYVLMEKIYANADIWKDPERVQELRAGKPGVVLCEPKVVHDLLVGSKHLSQSAHTCYKLDSMYQALKAKGYASVPSGSEQLYDLSNGDVGDPFVGTHIQPLTTKFQFCNNSFNFQKELGMCLCSCF